MQRCIELASIAKSNGKYPVGSVIVENETIIAEGIEGDSAYPGLIAHSEIIAVIKAVEIIGSYDLSYCTLYSTVEPCFMCSYTIRRCSIPRVVYAVSAGEIGGASSDFPFLLSSRFRRWGAAPEVISGVLAEEYRSLL